MAWPPKIIQAHNFYRSSNPSGENAVVEREHRLLEGHGIPVVRWWEQSDAVLAGGTWARLRTAWNLHAPKRKIAAFRQRLDAMRGDILHAHNVWPLLTYGLFAAAKASGLPTAQSLHNYRLIATDTHFIGPEGARRPGSEAERQELRRMPAMHGRIANRLYTRTLRRYWRESAPQSLVDAYICLTGFQKKRMIAAGIPEERIVVKPNFVDWAGAPSEGPGEFALFIGRLSPEKGITELLEQWPRAGLPLKIVGSGPLSDRLPRLAGVEHLGRQTPEEVRSLLARARFLVMNSQWYEGLPLVVIEAFAAGVPCLLPAIGSLTELVDDGRTGLLFRQDDLADRARALWELAPALRRDCRAEYEQRYTPAANARTLTTIYRNLLERRRPDTGVN